MTRSQKREKQQAESAMAVRDANRAACPVATTLFDTLVSAQTAGRGDQNSIASFIIQVGGAIEQRHEVSAEDAERVLHACGLWPETLPVREAKAEFGGVEFYRVEIDGVSFWMRPADPGPVTHLVLLHGREVARFEAKNDHHAANKARKLFGADARAVLAPRPVAPVADPFERIAPAQAARTLSADCGSLHAIGTEHRADARFPVRGRCACGWVGIWHASTSMTLHARREHAKRFGIAEPVA